MLARTLMTFVLIFGIGGLLWADYCWQTDVGFNLIIFVAVVLSVQEFYDLTSRKGYTPYSLWGVVCAGLLVLADWLGHVNFHPELHWVGIVCFVFLGVIFLQQGWLRPREHGLVSMAVTTFAIVYIWGLAQFIVRLRYLPGIEVLGVVWMVAVVKFGDISAYLVGRGFGRHRPFRRISPNKSVEGYIGGLAGSVFVGLLGGWLLFGNWREWLHFGSTPWYNWVVFSVALGIAGHLGDLAESIIKRDLGAKDSASRLPGMGGVLDVFDSLLLASPVAFYFFEQFVR